MRIETPRLLLREFAADDWPAVLAYQQHPAYLRYYPWETRAEDDARRFIQMFIDQQSASPRRDFQLVIALKETGTLIGNCGLRRAGDNEWEGAIGYELAPSHWGRGFATEAARAMVDFGFGQLGLHRISSWCIADNAASARVLERVGMRLEGRLRENAHFKGRRWDTLLFGMLGNEWRP
ncbi:MAG: GNAT family N-acetyltransferase [SAR202 cluster bacterium]|nr:GNAT family N-acetyltransferase [SAR202 cluster bacterium]